MDAPPCRLPGLSRLATTSGQQKNVFRDMLDTVGLVTHLHLMRQPAAVWPGSALAPLEPPFQSLLSMLHHLFPM